MHQQAFLVGLLPLVAAHGFLSSPEPRRPGDAYRAACGDQPFYQQSSDINGNVQGIQQVAGSDTTADCNLWLCKGFLFEDNTDKVQSYSLGQTIDIVANIAAPHTGYANVSVVKTSTNTMIGTPLIEFSNYASNAGVDANNTRFSVTLPQTLGTDCTTAGDCVLQWFWDAPDIDQTYASCVDFTVSGDSAGGDTGGDDSSSSAPATSVAEPTTTAAAATSTSVDTAPATTTAVPDDDECPAEDDEEDDEEEEDDDECPADGDDDEEEDEDEDEEECPAEDGDDEDDEDEEDDTEECPADDGDEEEAAATTALTVKDVPTSDAAGPAPTSTITMVVTSTVVSERLVTVTAEPTACI
jgi:hypothetical protein